jgi:hypothetical protein
VKENYIPYIKERREYNIAGYLYLAEIFLVFKKGYSAAIAGYNSNII